jgi:hypothetical protein
VTEADQGGLFELTRDPRRPTRAELSPDARRTARQRDLVDTGWHPLTRTRTRPDLGTCGGCVHRRKSTQGSYPKCGLGPITSGPGTDVRAWWPACERFEARRD